jgi:hypothetical protein
VLPGLYLKHIAGEGAMAKITASSLIVYYRMWSSATESEYGVSAVLSGTEESIQHSLLSDTKNEELVKQANESDYTFLRSPNGIYTQLTFNIKEIMENHENDSVSTVRVFLPSRNDKTESEYNFGVPETLLLLRSDSIYDFFGEKKVANAKSSFLTKFSDSTNGYTFSNISPIIVKMFKEWKASGKSYDEYCSDPENANWNKVLIVPVETSYSTISSTTQLTKVSHSMDYSSTRMRRGIKKSDDDDVEEINGIKASIIYSRYKTR